MLLYIAALDPDADARLLRRQLQLPLKSIEWLRISGRLLQIGAAEGLTLAEIAELVCRQDVDTVQES